MKDLLKKHRDTVRKLGYSSEQADEIIHRFSEIMGAFIDAAWGVHSAQLSVAAKDKKVLLPDPRCDKMRTKQKQCSGDDAAASLTEG